MTDWQVFGYRLTIKSEKPLVSKWSEGSFGSVGKFE